MDSRTSIDGTKENLSKIRQIRPNKDRLILLADLDSKNRYKLTENITIALERNIENFNKRETHPCNATVVGGDMDGIEVLVDYNSLDPTNLIFDIDIDLPPNHKIYSVPENEVYCYYDTKLDKWRAYKGFLLVERVWQPYEGVLVGIEPTEIKNVLFCVDGEYEGKALMTARYCDFTIIFQGKENREQHITRMRDNDYEVECVSLDLTAKIYRGDLFIGETASLAKKFAL